MRTLSPNPRYRPASKHLVPILGLAGGAWVVLPLGLYLFGVGALTLLDIIGGVL